MSSCNIVPTKGLMECSCEIGQPSKKFANSSCIYDQNFDKRVKSTFAPLSLSRTNIECLLDPRRIATVCSRRFLVARRRVFHAIIDYVIEPGHVRRARRLRRSHSRRNLPPRFCSFARVRVAWHKKTVKYKSASCFTTSCSDAFKVR